MRLIDQAQEAFKVVHVGPEVLDLGRPLAERVVGEIVDGGTHDREARGQQALFREVIDRWQKLLAAQVAGGAEDDHDRGVGDSVVVKTFGEGIGLRHRRRAHFRAASALASLTTAWPPN